MKAGCFLLWLTAFALSPFNSGEDPTSRRTAAINPDVTSAGRTKVTQIKADRESAAASAGSFYLPTHPHICSEPLGKDSSAIREDLFMDLFSFTGHKVTG